MEKITLSTLAAFVLLTGAACASSSDEKWSYEGANGPNHWQAMCQDGKNQSPINVTASLNAKLPPLALHYNSKARMATHNGHAIQLGFHGEPYLTVEGEKVKLLQTHFHSPSENTIEGEQFPLEAHYVHQSKDGALTVLAVLFREGAQNKSLAKIIHDMPKKAGATTHPKKLKAGDLLPDNLGYYRYNGSLTTPPCSEGVRWLVLKSHPEISANQIQAFKAPFHGPTNRPVQPLNARHILK